MLCHKVAHWVKCPDHLRSMGFLYTNPDAPGLNSALMLPLTHSRNSMVYELDHSIWWSSYWVWVVPKSCQISDIQTTQINILLLDCCSRFFFRACMPFFLCYTFESTIDLRVGSEGSMRKALSPFCTLGIEMIWYTITYEWILTLLFTKIRWWWEVDPYCFWLNGLVGLPVVSSYCMANIYLLQSVNMKVTGSFYK